jgi:hypothetical protein
MGVLINSFRLLPIKVSRPQVDGYSVLQEHVTTGHII